MKTLNIMLSNLAGRVIPIGYEGENLFTQVRINCIEVFADYPDATVGMVVNPPVGDLYPAVLEKSGAIVVWNITDTVLSAQGAGECQLTFTEGDVVRKSVIFGFTVNRSLVANGEAPDPIEDWVENANRKLGELDGVVRDETDEWLSEHITNPDSPPLDRTLTSSVSAAPADMVGDLKSALFTSTGNLLLPVVNGKYINLSGTSADINTPSSLAGMKYTVDTCSQGDKYTISMRGGGSGRAYGFLNSSGTILEVAPANVVYTDKIVIAPQNATTFVANSYENDLIAYRGEYLVKTVKDFGLRDVLLADGIHVTAGTEINVDFNVGDVIEIVVSSITGTTNVYIKDHTGSGVLEVSSTGRKIYTVPFVGHLVLSPLGTGTIDAMVYISSDLRNNIEAHTTHIDQIDDAIYIPYNISARMEVGSIDSTYGTPTTNASHCRTKTFMPIGLTEVSFSPNYQMAICAYDNKGKYIGRWTGTSFSTSYQYQKKVDSPFDFTQMYQYGYIYKLLFMRNSGTASVSDVGATATVDVINNPAFYEVGTEGDYATLTEALEALKNDNHEKTIYIQPGEYDIFTEMGGAEFISSIDMTQNPTWRDVCKVVPPNTTIIGVGNVTLLWNPTDEQIIDSSHAYLFSPLNLCGSCTIKNINIRCSNCRYGIHDETGGLVAFNGITHIFEDINVVYNASTYGNKYAYGAGHNKNSTFIFRNCLFSSPEWAPWSSHDWPAGVNERSTFLFDNCVFLDTAHNRNGSIRLSTSDSVGRLDKVTIIGSVLSSIIYGTEGTSEVRQGYAVTAKLCNEIISSYDSHISETGRVDIVQYLTI